MNYSANLRIQQPYMPASIQEPLQYDPAITKQSNDMEQIIDLLMHYHCKQHQSSPAQMTREEVKTWLLSFIETHAGTQPGSGHHKNRLQPSDIKTAFPIADYDEIYNMDYEYNLSEELRLK